MKRTTRHMRESTYRAVVYLRHMGLSVYPGSGVMHLINGKPHSSQALVKRARQLGLDRTARSG